jgi:hypothetical protein
MNLDQAELVDIPSLTGKPMEEPTEYCEHKHALVVLLSNWLVSISSVSLSATKA